MEPVRSLRPAGLERSGRDAEGLAQVELRPTATQAGPACAPPVLRPRVSGPGRKERAYLERLADAERELETARLLERGTQRLIDRLERDVDSSRQIERRLALALGAMQAENQALRARLERPGLLECPAPAPARRWRWRGLRLRNREPG